MVKGKAIKRKVGDTLIEVTFAVGIFSMVAIAAVSVISASTSGTQNILENTVTRENIDAQAEALRFIQAAYTASGEQDMKKDINNDSKYAHLWAKMTERAIDPNGESDAEKKVMDFINNYSPATCNELYDTNKDHSLIKQNAFIINPRAIGSNATDDSYINNVIITPGSDNMGKFQAASTYPRIVYEESEQDALYGGIGNSTINSIEGLFIVAVKDGSNTTIISDETGDAKSLSAYIDFYIRSCWFATGAERPSTISTVIRLYNPDNISANKYNRKRVLVKYNSNGGSGNMPNNAYYGGEQISLEKNKFNAPGEKVFWGWKDQAGNTYEYSYEKNKFEKDFTVPADVDEVTLTAIWKYKHTLNYYDTDKTSVICTETEFSDSKSKEFTIKGGDCNSTSPDDTNNNFRGWSEDEIYGSDPLYNEGDKIAVTGNVNLYPVWREKITWSVDDWAKIINTEYDTSKEDKDCRIFHVNEPSSGNKESVFANTVWWENTQYGYKNIAPMNGWLVSSKNSTHIETFSETVNGVVKDGVNFQGYCNNSGKKIEEGIYYTINQNDLFELSFNMDTTNMSLHPGGHVEIDIGPLSAKITDVGKISASCDGETSSSSSRNFASGTRINLSKHGNKYSITIGNGADEIKTCTPSDYYDEEDEEGKKKVKISYKMTQKGHNCKAIFSVQLTNIIMTQFRQ